MSNSLNIGAFFFIPSREDMTFGQAVMIQESELCKHWNLDARQWARSSALVQTQLN